MKKVNVTIYLIILTFFLELSDIYLVAKNKVRIVNNKLAIARIK